MTTTTATLLFATRPHSVYSDEYSYRTTTSTLLTTLNHLRTKYRTIDFYYNPKTSYYFYEDDGDDYYTETTQWF